MVRKLGAGGATSAATAPVAPPLERGKGTEQHLIAKASHDAQQLKTFTRWCAPTRPTQHLSAPQVLQPHSRATHAGRRRESE